MTRTLILMRHAKSSWNSPDLDDHARPLNGRGQRSAFALGDWLRKEGLLPDEVLCSSSVRTRETLAGLALNAPASYLDSLYHADPDTMLEVLSGAKGATVLMIGHNPGIAGFAARVLSGAPSHPRFADYPTGATLVARFDTDDWSSVAWRSGEPTGFIVPRELPGV